MDKRRFFSFFLLILLLSSFISGCAGVSRIDDFFSNDEYLQHGKIIDFALFFVMFFALSYLGLTKVWGEGYGKPGTGKGAIVALSIALSLALAFALVTQTRFSITTIFPMAKAVFFLIMTFLLAGLIIHSKVFGEGTAGKVIAFIISALAIYLVVSIGTHMVCQMSDNMDDPACKSDFFNAMFETLGRWFGIDSWTSAGREAARGGPGGGVAPTGPTAPGAPAAAPTGPVEGGCRLDITFDVGSATSLTSAAPIAEYVKSVKAMGKTKVIIHGYASMEGGERYNFGLGGARGRTIANMITAADPSITTSVDSGGATDVFDSANYPPNRRVVLVTENIGKSIMPSPAPFSAFNCPTPTTPQVCGDHVVEGNEECDGNDDSKCPKACQSNCTCPVAAAPTPTPSMSGTCGNDKKEGSEQCDGTDASACPGKCVAVGQPQNCTCPAAAGVIPPTCKNKLNDANEVCDPTAPDDKCPDTQHCSDDCTKCVPGPATAATGGGGGWFHWWYLLFLLLIPLAFVGYRVGYHEVQRYKYGKHIGGINDELLKLIRLAKDTLAAVTQNIKKNDLSDDEKALFGDAVRYGSMGLRKRIERNLGPAGINSVVFAPYLTADQRKQLIEGVFAYVKAMRKAKHIVEWKVKYWFWPKLRTLNKMKEGLIKAKVTPILHEDKSVTFRYYHRTGYPGTPPVSNPHLVKLLLRPAGGAPAAIQSFDLDPVNRGRKIWSFKTTPLADGDYEYVFEVLPIATVPPGAVARLIDEHNWKKTGNDNLTDWSKVTVKDVEDIVDEMIPRAPVT